MFSDIRKAFFVLTFALVFGAIFVFPNHAAATVTLPTTSCDTQWAELNHIGDSESAEDGTKAFKFGPNNNDFVSETGEVVTFKPQLLFTPDATAIFKVYVLNSSCAVIYGDSSPAIQAGLNTITYTKATDQLQFNSEESSSIHWLPGYLSGFDVWDGVNGSTFDTYTYLIDMDSLANPAADPIPEPEPEGAAPPPSFFETKKQNPEDLPEPEGLRPILIIPGITGSELYENGELVWPPGKLGTAFNAKDKFLTNSLALDEKGNSVKNVISGDIIRKINFPTPFFDVNIFDALISDLKNNNYISGENYFIFPYDWRLDFDKNIELLDKIINKNKKGFHKIDIVAHSMGGLLVKDYINKKGSDQINKLIFVGTPHLGAPKAAKVLLEGDIDIPLNLLNKETMKQLSLNMPSIYQLLPNRKYFELFTGYINLSAERWQTPYMLDYDWTRDFLKNKNVNTYLLDQAQEAQALSELDLSGIDVYNITGCGTNTQAGYRFTSIVSPIAGIGYTSGDQTVPFMSARQVNTASDKKFYVKGVKHSELPSGSRALILDILQNNKPALDEISTSNGTHICDYKGKSLTWKSPVEVHIYDQNNNHAGPTSEGGFENNLNIIDYEIIDGIKFIFIPTDDSNTYSIQAKGEAAGVFDLIISDISNGEVTSSQVFNDVAITEASKIAVDLYQNKVKFDYSGSGHAIELKPDSTLAEGSDDLVPPQTFIETAGNEEITIKLTASDSKSGSGILHTKYSINGKPYETYTEPVMLEEFGSVVFKYYSVDKAGNNEPVNERQFNIEYNPGKVLGTSTGLKDGTLVLDSVDNRTVYIVGTGGKKYGFISEEVFKGLGYNFDNLVSADISDYELGGYVYTVNGPHPDGSLVRDDSGAVWVINFGKRFGFSSEELSKSFEMNNIIKANWYDLNLPFERIE